MMANYWEGVHVNLTEDLHLNGSNGDIDVWTVGLLTVSVPLSAADDLNGSANGTGNATVTTGSPSPHTGLQRSVVQLVLIGFILALIIVVTICGNLLVCVTIITNKKLQNFTNFFVLSLATTDLLLGCSVLPFSALNTLGTSWPLGAIFCNIFTSADVMICTVSILTLFAISLDRYFAITKPFKYQTRMNASLVWKINAAIWISSLLMAFVPIHVGWNTPSGEVQNWAAPTVCVFELNKPYVLLISLGTYFAPLFIMCAVYLKVLKITRDQVKQINRMSKAGGTWAATKVPMLPEKNQADAAYSPTAGGNGAAHDHNGRRKSSSQHIISANNGSADDHRCHHKNGDRHHGKREKDHRVVSDTKATVTLASVVLAFAICWIPYFVLFTAKPFLVTEVNIHLELVALWLGYVNSSINPFLYAFYNSAFREGFKKVLCARSPCRPNSFRGNMHQLPVPSRRHGSSTETSELSVLRHTVN